MVRIHLFHSCEANEFANFAANDPHSLKVTVSETKVTEVLTKDLETHAT